MGLNLTDKIVQIQSAEVQKTLIKMHIHQEFVTVNLLTNANQALFKHSATDGYYVAVESVLFQNGYKFHLQHFKVQMKTMLKKIL